jgi:hypothetical protein
VANSFVMVVFLSGLVVIILMRTVKKDYARYAAGEGDMESLERDLSEETGWKLVHGAQGAAVFGGQVGAEGGGVGQPGVAGARPQPEPGWKLVRRAPAAGVKRGRGRAAAGSWRVVG